MTCRQLCVFFLTAPCLAMAFLTADVRVSLGDELPEKVSFYHQIRPIFQANCQGCHQPARASGHYVMTSFDKLLVGGESGSPAIVPENPDASYLIELITPVDGAAEMPQDKKPLARSELDLVRRWIEQGAADDTPAGARQRFDMEHPPVYTRPPVITSLDFSPDGSLLAVAGFHEVLLLTADGQELLARLIGMSERIESVSFSPDGTLLAVTGGLPARMGEVQVWDVAQRTLLLSVPTTFDTVYGGKWSPDGKLIAFGCADNTVRAIDATTGEQVLYQGAHEDWVRDTVFSMDGSHLVSVARDMTCKLTEVGTQRFVDNVTSITPGVLKGGLASVARHPERDEIVVGGADGIPKVYRMHRLTRRVIGDDANLARRLPAMSGRIQSVAISRDGRHIAAASALDGAGAVHIYAYDFDTSLPDEVKKIMEKTVQARTAEEKAKVEKYQTEGVKQIAATSISEAGVYAVAFRPDSQVVAAAGADGIVRLIRTDSGEVSGQFSPAPISNATKTDRAAATAPAAEVVEELVETEVFPEGTKLTSFSVYPESIQLGNAFEYVQLVVTGRLDSGDTLDVTRMVRSGLSAPVVNVSPTGLIRPRADGQATLRVAVADQSVDVPVTVSGISQTFDADFIRDVNPVLSRLGCNAGTCHGAAQGKNGFKLSLRGYDPLFDVRALTDDLASRRVNVASPDDSLMLLKPTGAVPHVGGQLMRPGESSYEILRSWIANGAGLKLSMPRVMKIDVFPLNPVIQTIDGRQQVRVLATYADGLTRDVTREAFIESGDTEIASTAGGGLMLALRRGEAPVLARYEGAYAATILTVMGDRSDFVWEDPPSYNEIDQFVAAKWKRMKIRPSSLCTDAEFVRRVYLDVTGSPPSSDAVRQFLEDDRDTRVKRDELVDRLVGSEEYVDHWTNKWADLLQVNAKFLGPEGANLFRQWIRDRVAANTPYDQFVQMILTASGSNKENPAASYYKILRSPEETMENTTHLFLAVRFNCNKCHDHPFERWTQNQYYETAAYFARVGLKRDPASGKQNIGGTAVEEAKPLYEVVFEKPEGEVEHIRTGQVTPPQFPYECDFQSPDGATRRQQISAWITSPDNPYFAKSYVNRLWGYLLGVGIMEPLDDIRAGNPPTNPDLLEYLTSEFVESGFDVAHVIRRICKSRTYQLSIETNRWNEDDRINYSHATARRLPAEVLFDSIHFVTGSLTKMPGVPQGTRVSELADAALKVPSGFLTNLGRPARESACECERTNDLQLGSVMALISGPTVSDAIADPNNALAKLIAEETDDTKLVHELFLRILNRTATEQEIQAFIETMQSIDTDHEQLMKALEEREQYVAAQRPRLEREREQAIAEAKADLESYEKKIAPQVAEQERQKAEKTAQLEAELKEYEQNRLPQLLAEWEKKYRKDVEWFPLESTALAASNGAKLTRLADRSILAEGKDDKGSYTVSVQTNLTGITGIRLEALPDERIKGGGPGLASNGNFVITEFAVQASPKTNPKQVEAVALHQPQADFAQENLDIPQAIDGQTRDQRGWAVYPSTGIVHWATFQTKKPIGFDGGTILHLTLHQFHNAPAHRLGRFRISVTTDKQPVGLSFAEELKAIVAVAAKDRSKDQNGQLLKYFRKVEPGVVQKEGALAESRRPLPVDPGLKQRQDMLEYLSRPIPDDVTLVQLRQDVEFSGKQSQNRRLTAAQDLAWALINNPAFLFNR